MSEASTAGSRAATATEIREIVGPIDDEVVVKILDIGPTAAEVLEAYTWLGSDELRRNRQEHELHGRSARVLEILDDVFAEPDAP